jgi:uncharacterized membrane protein HdeD (DUF308 family)
MANLLARNWWALALRGVLAIIFGVLVLLMPPGAVIQSFVLLFGAYALVDGVFAIISAVQHRTERNWWVHLLEGIVGVLAGILVFAYPVFSTITATFFVLYIVAFWAILTGIMEIWAAIELRRVITNEFWLGLGGLLSIIFGLVLIFGNPANGILTLLLLVAIYSIAFGVTLLILAFRLRGMGGSSNQTPLNTPTRGTV